MSITPSIIFFLASLSVTSCEMLYKKITRIQSNQEDNQASKVIFKQCLVSLKGGPYS